MRVINHHPGTALDDSELQELQKETFLFTNIIIGALAGIYLVFFALFHTSRAQFFPYWWLPPGLAIATSFVAHQFYTHNKFRPATYIFIGGLTLTVVSLMFWPHLHFFDRQVYGLLLVVALAGLLISPMAALQTAHFASITTVMTAFYVYGLSWQTLGGPLFPLLLIYCMAIISSIGSSHLTTTLQWAYNSQARAQQRSSELFESQLELQKAYELLETANFRLGQAEAAARQASEFKTRFITNLSHELRTPLSAIINFSYILSRNQRGPVSDEQREYLVRIQDAGELLLEIVNDLLDLAKIEAGQMDLFVEPVDLAAIGRSVVNTTAGLLTDKPVELVTDFSPLLPIVYADGTRVRQILLNLMGNAAKYTDKGRITLRMLTAENDTVQISVIDTGIGIREEDFERIFEEFQQTEDAFALRKVGTGLGLPISQKFAQLHGGSLTVSSVYGQGSTFCLTLPINAPDLREKVVMQEVAVL